MFYLYIIYWYIEGWIRLNNWFVENKLFDIWCGWLGILLCIVLCNFIKCSVFIFVSKLFNIIIFKNINNKILCILVFFYIENVIYLMSLLLFGIVESCYCEWMMLWII